MKYLFKNMVIALILLSSAPAIAQEDTAVASTAQVTPVEPANAPPKGPLGYDPSDAKVAFEKTKGELNRRIAEDPLVKAQLKKITDNIEAYQENNKTCRDREDKANTFCMESRNPEVKNYLVIAQVLMAGVSGMTDACSKFGKVMDAGNKMLTSYQALCSTWRGVCLQACKKATKNVNDVKTAVEAIQKNTLKAAEKLDNETNPPTKTYVENANLYNSSVSQDYSRLLDRELQVDGKNYQPVAQKLATCEGYSRELAASAVGLLSMAKSFGEANKCDQNTTAVATPTPLDCTLAANKQSNMTCICQDAPRTPGCAGGLDSTASAKSADSLRTASTSDYIPGKATGNAGVDGGGGSELDLASKNDGAGGSLPGAPMGGGAGIDGGGHGGSDSGLKGGSRPAGLNANILGGEGGGGGGGSWGGGGSDGNGHGLRQYLPGGAKDPTALAGQGAVSKEVTSQGGKSNWEKVRERYRDNKPSLLGY